MHVFVCVTKLYKSRRVPDLVHVFVSVGRIQEHNLMHVFVWDPMPYKYRFMMWCTCVLVTLSSTNTGLHDSVHMCASHTKLYSVWTSRQQSDVDSAGSAAGRSELIEQREKRKKRKRKKGMKNLSPSRTWSPSDSRATRCCTQTSTLHARARMKSKHSSCLSVAHWQAKPLIKNGNLWKACTCTEVRIVMRLRACDWSMLRG